MILKEIETRITMKIGNQEIKMYTETKIEAKMNN